MADNTDTRALLAAQAAQGIDGVNAYRQAQQQVEQQRQAALAAALSSAQRRGAPMGAQAEVAGMVNQPASAVQQSLGMLASNYDSDIARRAARSNLYAQDVESGRGLIGAQAAAAGSVIDAQTRSKIAELDAAARIRAQEAAKKAAADKRVSLSNTDLQSAIFSDAAQRLGLAVSNATQLGDKQVSAQAATEPAPVAPGTPGGVPITQQYVNTRGGPVPATTLRTAQPAAVSPAMARMMMEKADTGTSGASGPAYDKAAYDALMDRISGGLYSKEKVVAPVTSVDRAASAAAIAAITGKTPEERAAGAEAMDPVTAAALNKLYDPQGTLGRADALAQDPQAWQDAATTAGADLLKSGQYKNDPAEVLNALGFGAVGANSRNLADYQAGMQGQPYGAKGEATAAAAERSAAAEKRASDAAERAAQSAATKEANVRVTPEVQDEWDSRTAGSPLEGVDLDAISKSMKRDPVSLVNAISGDMLDALSEAYTAYTAQDLKLSDWMAEQDTIDPLLAALLKQIAS